MTLSNNYPFPTGECPPALPGRPKAVLSGGALRSHFSVDVDWSLSHLCPPCPVKLQWKSLDFLKPSAVSQLLLGLCPMCFTHDRQFSKSENTSLGGQCIKRAKLMAARDLLEVMEQRRKVTKTVGRVHGVWAGAGTDSRTVAGPTLVSLQQREACRNPMHCSAGRVSQAITETHPALAGSVTFIWPHPQAFH